MIGRHGQKYLLTEVTTSINLTPGLDWKKKNNFYRNLVLKIMKEIFTLKILQTEQGLILLLE